MKAIQIRNIPDETYELLKERAKVDRRSIQQEAAWLLEQGVKVMERTTTSTGREQVWARLDAFRARLAQKGLGSEDSTSIIREMRDSR